MLPITAMPSAPPNSLLVSDNADAAPARSGGAAPSTMSVVNVTTGVSPIEKTIEPATSIASGEATSSTSASSTKPAAETAMPPAITLAGWKRRTIAGVNIEPTMKASADGNPHRPACSGDRPSTDCRYWAMNRKVAKAVQKPRTFTASAPLNAGCGTAAGR